MIIKLKYLKSHSSFSLVFVKYLVYAALKNSTKYLKDIQ